MGARSLACAFGSGGWCRAGVAIGAALPLAMLLACGGEETPAGTGETAPPAAAGTPPTTPPTAPRPDENIRVTQGELPADYPADLPQPPSATAQASMMAEGAGLVAFLSTESPEAVTDHFEKSLPEQGWQVASATGDATRTMIAATKDTRAVSVTVSRTATGEGADVVVVVQKK
jgi:hypothetical protein